MADIKAKYVLQAEDRTALALKKAKRSFNDFGKSVNKVGGLLATFGVGLSGGALALAAKNAVDLADSIDKAAQRAGLSAQALQELRFAGDQVGVSTKTLDDGMRRLTRRLGEFANSGSGPAKKALEGLNIAVRDTAGNLRPTEAVFLDIVKKLESFESQAERAAYAAQLFGDDAGPQMELLIRQGVNSIDDLRKVAQETGGILSDELIAKGVRAKDAMGRLSLAFTGTANTLLLQLAPVLEDLADFLTKTIPGAVDTTAEAFRALRHFILEGVQQVAGGLSAVAGGLADFSEALDDALTPGGSTLTALENMIDITEKLGGDQAAKGMRALVGTMRSVRDEATSGVGLDELSRSLENVADDYKAAAANIEEYQRRLVLDVGQQSGDRPAPKPFSLPDLGAGIDAQLKEAAKRTATAMKEVGRAIDDATGPYQDWLELQREGIRVFEATRSPLERFDAQIRRISMLFEGGFVNQDTANRAIEQAAEGFGRLGKKAEETSDQMSQFSIQAAREMEGAFADFLFDPFDDGLKGMLQGFVDTLRRMASEALSAELMDKLFGTGRGQTGGSGSTGDKGWIADIIQIAAAFLHEGGIAGAPGSTRQVPALAFAGTIAPRLHNGGIIDRMGIKPNEIPAILEKGEGVFTKEQMAAMGGGGMRQAAPQNISLVVVDERKSVEEVLAGSVGEKMHMLHVQRNAQAIKRILS